MLPAAPPHSLNIEELLMGVFPKLDFTTLSATTSCFCFFISSLPQLSFHASFCSPAFLHCSSVCPSTVKAHVHIICRASDNKGLLLQRPSSWCSRKGRPWNRQTGQIKWMVHTWRVAVVGPCKLVAITMCKERDPEREW